jgi:hypothetical protein
MFIFTITMSVVVVIAELNKKKNYLLILTIRCLTVCLLSRLDKFLFSFKYVLKKNKNYIKNVRIFYLTFPPIVTAPKKKEYKLKKKNFQIKQTPKIKHFLFFQNNNSVV